MLDLPGAMKAVGFKYAAYCADRWFKGKAHIIPELSTAIQSDNFVDKDTFKLSWILRTADVKKKFDHLTDSSEAKNPKNPENIYNEKARAELVRRFSQYMANHGNTCSGSLDTLTYCGNDIQKLHREFHFQHCGVSMVDVLGGYLDIVPQEIFGKEIMNDLAASLANFNFYAAVAHATVSTSSRMWYDTAPWRIGFKTKVEITHIYVYAKDVYSFNDESRDSQYLGHWNRYGVIIAYDAFIAQKFSGMLPKRLSFESGNDPRPYWPNPPEHLNRPVDTGSKFTERQVFYPVRNRDFNNWRQIKKRGGDFAIYSDLRKIRLPQPMLVELPEVFKDYKK